jgi:hypothetical protein
VGQNIRAHVDACRQIGLVVDEDFERGVSPKARFVRTGLLTLFIVLVALGAGAMIEPPRFNFTRLHAHPAAHPARSHVKTAVRPVRV